MICTSNNWLPFLQQLQSLLAFGLHVIVDIITEWKPERNLSRLGNAFLPHKIQNDLYKLDWIAWLCLIFFR